MLDIPFPTVTFAGGGDPISAIVSSPEFAKASEIFASDSYWRNSLITFQALSLLYSMIRNQRPNHVAEIGTFEGRTALVMAGALSANGHGTVHTVGPYDSEHFLPLFKQWPERAKQRLAFYPVNSMTFFTDVKRIDLKFELVFIDGNHDYEFVVFDILAASQAILPGGFIVLDNVSQAGPSFATIDFLELNPEWLLCGSGPLKNMDYNAFDRTRANIPGTDFFVLRAPDVLLIKSRPRTFRPTDWQESTLNGVRISLAGGAVGRGTIHLQCIVRTFNPGPATEAEIDTLRDIDGNLTGEVTLPFDEPMKIPGNQRCTVEIWLAWSGQTSLPLSSVPTVF